MAEEDLIFEIEGVDDGRGNSADDSDDEEQYLICPITDYDDHNKTNKICNRNYLKGKFCETSSSPVRSFNVKVPNSFLHFDLFSFDDCAFTCK